METGWITTAAWCFACGGPPSILANIITSLAAFNNEAYHPERWHTSLIMIATMVVPFIFNLWFRKVLDTFEMAGGILHIILFIVFIVVLIVFGPKSNPEFVFNTLISDASGWNNSGVSWGLGLLTVTFSVTGMKQCPISQCSLLRSLLRFRQCPPHECVPSLLSSLSSSAKQSLGDEVKKVHTRVPHSIVLACTVNSVMLVVFAVVLLFFIGPLDAISDAPLPLVYVIYGATGSKSATNVLVSLIAVIVFFALFNAIASVSRLIWVFATDKGLPFSEFFAYVSRYPFKLLQSLLRSHTSFPCYALNDPYLHYTQPFS
jgi:choline transport protein